MGAALSRKTGQYMENKLKIKTKIEALYKTSYLPKDGYFDKA